jgi:hypothetical protein
VLLDHFTPRWPGREGAREESSLLRAGLVERLERRQPIRAVLDDRFHESCPNAGIHLDFSDFGFALAGSVTGSIAGVLGYPSVFATGALSAIVAVVVAFRGAGNRNAAS